MALINALSCLLAYLLAGFLRFGMQMVEPWQLEFYATLLIVTLLIAAAIHFYRVSTGSWKSVESQDPLELLTYVIRSKLFLLFGIILFLFATQQAPKVSRRFLATFVLLDVVIESAARMVYRRRIIRREHNIPVDRTVDIITTREYADMIRRNLGQSLPSNVAVQNVLFYEEKESWLSSLSYQPPLKEVYLYLPGIHRIDEKALVRTLQDKGLTVQLILSCFHTILTKDLISQESSYLTASFDTLRTTCNVLGIRYTVSTPGQAALYIRDHLDKLRGQYICFSNVHTTVTAKEDPSYLAIQNGSAYTFPDGAPIAREQIRQGCTRAKRIAGPDFMSEMFRLTQYTKIRHYFLGSTEETLQLLRENLKRNYPGLQIAGMYSPPFRDLTSKEDDALMTMLSDAHADIYWIGLGAPRQEIFMAHHKDQLTGVMMGVGAGFNFHAGNIKRAPVWMQKAGLEWLYRLFQDPKRLISRYVVTNFRFGLYLLKDRLAEHRSIRKQKESR